MFKDNNQAKAAMTNAFTIMRHKCRVLYAGNETIFKSDILKNKIHRLEMEIIGLSNELDKDLTLTYSTYKEL